MDNNTEEFEGGQGKSSISADLIRGHINTIILRSLYDRDKYGYEIINEINEKSHGQYTLKQPTLYSALKRLENQGYIQAYWKNDEVSAGGRRKYFRLTESGREITEHNQAEWEYSRTVIDNLISDRNFDFNQPAPTPVDFKILKQATSRVPVIHGEDGEEQKEEKPDKTDETGMPSVEARTYTVSEDVQTIYIDDPTKKPEEKPAEEKKADDTPSVAYTAETEKPLTYSEQLFESGMTAGAQTASGNADTAPATQEPAPTPVQEPVQQPTTQVMNNSEPAHEYIAQPAETQQTTYSEHTESYNESYDVRRGEHAGQQDNYARQSPYSDEEINAERARYTSQLGRSAEEESRRRAHENYLKLISGDDDKKRSEPEDTEQNTDRLIYNARPEQERDYKNLIDKLFDSTLKNTEPAPVQQSVYAQPQPQVTPQPAEPVFEQVQAPAQEEQVRHPVRYGGYLDASKKAASDGLKISTSDEAFAAGAARQTTYNKGATLFKCSLIIGVIMLLEFTLTLLFMDELNVSIAYPIIILALGVATVLVCGILFGARYGNHIRKPTSLRYVSTACIITVLLIIIIFIFAFILSTDWSSTTEVLSHVVIPCIIALNIPIFTLSFYLFTKN